MLGGLSLPSPDAIDEMLSRKPRFVVVKNVERMRGEVGDVIEPGAPIHSPRLSLF